MASCSRRPLKAGGSVSCDPLQEKRLQWKPPRQGRRSTARGGEQDSDLRRAIGPRVLTVFIIGDILGAGIYALVGEVGAEVGGAIWTAFLVSFVLAFFTAFAYAELVTKYPRAAGAALYTHKAFRTPFFTFIVAFAVMSSGIASASTLARAFAGDYLSEFVDLPLVLAAIAFILIVAAINLRGIAESVQAERGAHRDRGDSASS